MNLAVVRVSVNFVIFLCGRLSTLHWSGGDDGAWKGGHSQIFRLTPSQFHDFLDEVQSLSNHKYVCKIPQHVLIGLS